MRMTFEIELSLCKSCYKLAERLSAICGIPDYRGADRCVPNCESTACDARAEHYAVCALEFPGYQQMLAACAKSEKKAAAVRENGKLGGRPKGRKNNPKPGA